MSEGSNQGFMAARDALRARFESNLQLIESTLRKQGQFQEAVASSISELKKQVHSLEEENVRLQQQVETIQEEVSDHGSEMTEQILDEIQRQNESLINLHIAEQQLHTAENVQDILNLVSEVIINLVGTEDFALYLKVEEESALECVFRFDEKHDRPLSIDMDDGGEIGKVIREGENHYWSRRRGEQPKGMPLAMIPLLYNTRVLGVLVIYDLLPQKEEIEDCDEELFMLFHNQLIRALLAVHHLEGHPRALSGFSNTIIRRLT